MTTLKSDKIATLPLKEGKAAYYNDGGGLYVICEPSGDDINRSYNFRYSIRGARCWLRLGGIDELKLQAAREKVIKLRDQVRQGIDPRRVIDSTAAGQVSFKQYFEKHKDDFREAGGNAEYLWDRAISKMKAIHNRAIAEITLDEVNHAITPFWKTNPVSASRVLQMAAKVFDKARVNKLRLDNPAALNDLRILAPKVFKPVRNTNPIEPHAALPYANLPAFVKKLSYEKTSTAQCALFAVLTALRSQEAREARWSWLNDDKTVITIPAEFMKGKQAHIIPLATQLTELLNSLPRTSDYIFPSRSALNRDKLIHANSLAALVRVHGGAITMHGFRSTFRDYAAVNMLEEDWVLELCLAHKVKVGSAVRAAYQRDKVVERRRVVMQAYADYATGKAPKGNVVRFRAA